MSRVTAKQALDNCKNNEARHWSSNDQYSFKSRVSQDSYFPVLHRPKFKLDSSCKVYTVGSCFARNVENVLKNMGVNVVLSGTGLHPNQYADWDNETKTGGDTHVDQGLSPRCLNKYDTKTMLQEFRHVLTENKMPNEGLIELHSGKFFDPLVGSVLGLHSEVEALENRQKLNEDIIKIKECNVTFITLGLTEGWVDIATGYSLNEHPGLRELMRFQDKFYFDNHSYPDVLCALEDIVSVIRKYANADMKFIVTVSPVTLWMTFEDHDVVMSNTYSKAVLRAAAGELCKKNSDIDYFPSFEMVMNTPRHLAWAADQHHVTSGMVAFVMERFKEAYFTDPV
jgi:hypothetical protein